MRNRIFLVLTITVVVLFAVNSGWLSADTECPNAKKGTGGQTETKTQCPNSGKEGCGATSSGQICSDDCDDNLCSDKIADGRDEFPSWILSSHNEHYFSKALIDFRIINKRYPKNVAELIDSGMLVIWPANPYNGKPLKLTKAIKAVQADTGKVAYIRESDIEAHFETVIKVDGKYQIYKFPCCKTVERIMGSGECKVDNPKIYCRDSFEMSINGSFSAALSNEDFRTGKLVPVSVQSALKNNFFLIKENLKPDFISDNPKKPLYFEKGLAKLDGELVVFGKSTMGFCDCDGKETIETFSWITPIRYSDKEWVDDEIAWKKLTDKQYFYSTSKIMNGGINYSAGVLISKKDITS